MSSEQDPLLPRTQPAPEIYGYGYSRLQQAQSEEQGQEQDKFEDNEQDISTNSSPLTSILALFTIIVALSFLIALLLPGGLHLPRDNAKNETSSIDARVDKIMSENPLIG